MKLQEKDTQKMAEVILNAEELDTIIAPAMGANHNETFVVGTLDLLAEELEPVIAPRGSTNHSETFVIGNTELEAEELDAIIAPGMGLGNHNETFLRHGIGD